MTSFLDSRFTTCMLQAKICMHLHSREISSSPHATIGADCESFAVRLRGKSTVEPILTLGIISIYTFSPEYLGYGQPTRLRPDTSNAVPCINEGAPCHYQSTARRNPLFETCRGSKQCGSEAACSLNDFKRPRQPHPAALSTL
jgi:hypothetical protein